MFAFQIAACLNFVSKVAEVLITIITFRHIWLLIVQDTDWIHNLI